MRKCLCTWGGGLTIAILLSTTLFAVTLPDGYRLEPFVRGLDHPESIAMLPDGTLLVAERLSGDLRVVQNGELLPTPFLSLGVAQGSEEGLLGVAVDPLFTSNRFVYVYYTQASPKTNRIVRYRAEGLVGVQPTVLVDDIGASPSGTANGGALTFGADGYLYASVGTMGDDVDAQMLSSLKGKILRMTRDGAAPADNPYVAEPAPSDLIYALGLRDGRAMTWNKSAGTLYASDAHGSSGCDEVNVITSSGNFGWDVESCGNGSSFDPPMQVISPANGIDGLAAYNGSVFPGATNGLFVAGGSTSEILFDELGGANFDSLTSSSPFYAPVEAACPTNPTALAESTQGMLFVLADDPDTGEAGIYRVVYDAMGEGPREVSAGDVGMVVAKNGSGGLDFWWEDLKKDAWTCTDGHCPPGARSEKYTLWEGELTAPFSYSHNPLEDTNGTEVDDARVRHELAAMPTGNKYFLVSGWGANLESSLGTAADGERPGRDPLEADRCNAIGFDGNTVDQCLSSFPMAYPDQDGRLWTLEDFRGTAVKFSFAQFG